MDEKLNKEDKFALWKEKYGDVSLGYVEDKSFNNDWTEMGLNCGYEHCIEKMPPSQTTEARDHCFNFGHKCPDDKIAMCCRDEYNKMMAKNEHQSDCATHNEPAEPNGECDCGANGGNKSETTITLKNVRHIASGKPKPDEEIIEIILKCCEQENILVEDTEHTVKTGFDIGDRVRANSYYTYNRDGIVVDYNKDTDEYLVYYEKMKETFRYTPDVLEPVKRMRCDIGSAHPETQCKKEGNNIYKFRDLRYNMCDDHFEEYKDSHGYKVE